MLPMFLLSDGLIMNPFTSTYLNHHLINVDDVGMAKDSKCSMYIFAMTGETGEPWLHSVIVYRISY